MNSLTQIIKRRILVIDDNADLCSMVCELLRLLGHEATTADSGGDGVAQAKVLQPDIVLCDIGLPGLSGYDVARSIRADSRLSRTLLIAITGYTQQEDVDRALAAGFDHHLGKPIDLGRLRTLIEETPAARGFDAAGPG